MDSSAFADLDQEQLQALVHKMRLLEKELENKKPENKEELHAWIKKETGYNIPRWSVCENHDSPIDFLWDLFSYKVENALLISTRGGGKTENIAILHYANSVFKPGLTSLTVAATDDQAKRCYNYIVPWLRVTKNGKTVDKDYVSTTNKEKTIFSHDGSIENLPATVKALNGPHCHPPGELVLTTDGYVPVEQLNSEKHKLASYDPKKDLLTWEGTNNEKSCYPFKVDNWDFDGNLIKIFNPSGNTRVTPAHKVRVKFTDEFYDSYVVYLMRKDTFWRIGMTKGARLSRRLVEENGDSVWLLGTYEDKSDAVKHEAIFQAKYGITGICFPGKHRNNTRFYGTEKIHKTLEEESCERAVKLLKDLDMDPSLPLFGKYGKNSKVPKNERFKFTPQGWLLTSVSNLFSASGMFYVPVVTERFTNDMHSDHPISVLTSLTKEPYKGKVYGIDIKPYHYYVANRIAIHNTQVTHFDEVEVWEDPQAWKEAQNIPAAKLWFDKATGKTIQYDAQVVLTSTRKYPSGRIQGIVDRVEEARQDGVDPPYRVYIWCVKEVIQGQPTCREAPENAGKPDSELCNCHQVGSGRWKDKKPRTLNQICKGAFFRADGYRPLKEVQGTFRSNDQATWEAQQECMRPSAGGNYIPNWDLSTHGLRDYIPHPDNGPIHLGADFGYTDATAVNWIQLIKKDGIKATNWAGEEITLAKNTFVLVDEIKKAGLAAAQIGKMIQAKEDQWSVRFGKRWTAKMNYGDPQAVQARMDVTNAIGTEWSWPVKSRSFEDSVLRMRELFENEGQIYVVQPRVPNFSEQVAVWHQDEKGKEAKTETHNIDAVRYCIANMFIEEMIDLSVAQDGGEFQQSIVNSGKVVRRNKSNRSGPVGFDGDTTLDYQHNPVATNLYGYSQGRLA